MKLPVMRAALAVCIRGVFFTACRATTRVTTLWLQLYYLLVVFRGYFGGGGLRYVC